jgi:hypothetical protein
MAARENGLRRVGGLTITLAAAGVAGAVLVACTVGTQPSTSDTSSSSTSDSKSSSTSSGDYSGGVSSDSGSGGADASSGGS